MSALDELLLAIRQLQTGGVNVPLPPGTLRPTTLNVVSGASIDYNPLTKVFDMTITGSGGGGGGQATNNVVAGLNSNIPTHGLVSLRLQMTGTPGPFTLGGFSPPAGAPVGGQVVQVDNLSTDVPMGVADSDSGSIYPILTGSGTTFWLPPNRTAYFFYDGTLGKWKLQNIGAIYPDTVNVKDKGAKGDLQIVTDSQMSSGSAVLHSPSAPFTPADVGKLVTVYGASNSNVTGVLYGTIAGFTDSSHVTLSATATQTVGTPLAGTVSVTHASATITFSVAQTIKAGTSMIFASQPGVTYTLASDLIAGTVINLQTASANFVPGYYGTTNGATTATIVGFTRWCTDDTAAISAALSAAIVEVNGTFSAASEVFFPPGDYGVTSLPAFDLAFNGLKIRGAGPGEIAGLEIPSRSRITLMQPQTSFVLNTAQWVHVERMWFEGNRIATRVIDHEYFCVTQVWENCVFGGATVDGQVHFYGNDNGPFEIDFVHYYQPFLAGDFWDASYFCDSLVKNVNGDAFQITYHNGRYVNAVRLVYLTRGSCSFLGRPQFFAWASACFWVGCYAQPFTVEGAYNEQDTNNFLHIAPSEGGVFFTSSETVVLRDMQLNGFTGIYTAHTMRLKIENGSMNANIVSDPASATVDGQAFGIQTIEVDDLAFLNGADFAITSGNGGLIRGTYQLAQLPQVVVHDGAMNHTVQPQRLICSPSAPFYKQGAVGMPITVAGAGAAGADLHTWIIGFTSTTTVTLADPCSTTVTGATVSFGNTSLEFRRSVSPYEIVAVSGYDADSLYLGTAACIVGPGVPIIAADVHMIFTLTANRSYVLSDAYVSHAGQRMRISRVGASDAYGATINYNDVSPESIVLTAGMWAEFEALPSNGWMLVAMGGNTASQVGTVNLSSGQKTVNAGITVTANTVVACSLRTASGTLTSTSHYAALSGDMVVGGPGTGSITIKALEADGATVNTADTSQVGYLLIG